MNTYIEREVDFYLGQIRTADGALRDQSSREFRKPSILLEIESCFRSQIPERYRGLTLMALEGSLGIPKQMEAGWKKVYEWMSTREPGAGLILSGPVGTGKTTLACGILQSIALRSEACRFDFPGMKRESIWYQSMNTLADSIIASRTRGYGEYQDLAQSLRYADVLVVDDLGVTSPEGWVQKKIEEILCQRYEDRKATIITTNLGITALPTVLSERVVDRLQETCTFITLGGSSLRSATSRGTGAMASESSASVSL